MRGLARGAATTAVLALVLASCGLALSMPALAPENAATQLGTDAVTAPAPVSHGLTPSTTHGEAAFLHKAIAAPEPAVVPKPTLAAASVGPMRHVWQTLNNCGPAAVVMALSTLGIEESQEVARLALRGTDERRGMGPGPVGPWVDQRFGLRSMWRSNGTNQLMKTLVTNGFAPLVTQWMQDPWVSRISHWRTVRGYDDARGVFRVNDPMLGKDVPLSYDWFARNWQPFGYRYMVVYRAEDEPLLRAIVGEDWNDRKVRQNLYQRAKSEAEAEGTSAAWLAYGEAAYQYGLFAEAVEAIEKGMSLGSATGVFMLRSSLPNALRALGRSEDADAARARLANVTPGVSPANSTISTSFTLDPGIAVVVAERERHERALRRLLLKLERDR